MSNLSSLPQNIFLGLWEFFPQLPQLYCYFQLFKACFVQTNLISTHETQLDEHSIFKVIKALAVLNLTFIRGTSEANLIERLFVAFYLFFHSLQRSF